LLAQRVKLKATQSEAKFSPSLRFRLGFFKVFRFRLGFLKRVAVASLSLSINFFASSAYALSEFLFERKILS
jgi:hypothetical protein